MPRARCHECGADLSDAVVAGDGLCHACRGILAPTTAPASDLSRGVVVAGAGVRSADADGVAPARRLARLRAEALDWVRGRNGWVRLPLLLWFACILVRHLRDRSYDSLFGGLNLGIHELGHLVFSPLGEFLGVAGGTILQLAAPLIAGVLFLRQRDWFAIAVASCWLGTNLFEVARYAGDARARRLPLVSPTSGDPLHDWSYLLRRLGLLRHDLAIAGGLRFLAAVAMLAGLVAGTWLVWNMVRRPTPERA